MVTPQQATAILVDTIQHDRKHPHYDRVVSHAAMCKRFITGEGLENDLRQIVSRETEDQFKLRQKLFFPLAPAVCHRADVPFSKVHRAQGVVERIAYDGKGGEGTEERLKVAMDAFWGDEDMSDYFADRFRELNRADPNAWVIVEFQPFDPVDQRAEPYPLEISSAQAVNYSKRNNRTEWMIGKFRHSYTDADGKALNGDRYVMYFGYVLDFRQVYTRDAAEAFDPMNSAVQYVKIGGKVFECRILSPFAEGQQPRFQGIQAGHLKDPATDGETFISYLEFAKNRLMDSMKAGSEHSLVMALQAHPQVYMYLPPCDGEKMPDGSHSMCSGGKNMKTGSTCSACKGSGKRIPTSVLDVMVFDLPDNFTDTGLADLSKMRHMFAPDTAIITAIRDHLRDMEDQCIRDIFTSLQHKRGQATATATEINIDAEAMNDSLHPYARKVSTARTLFVELCAAFVDADKGLKYTHRFPEDFRLAPLSAVLDELGKANSSGASPILIDLIEEDAVAKKLKDRPFEFRQYQVRRLFRPLQGLASADRKAAIASGDVSEADKILLLYEAEVYREVGKDADFWYKPMDVQKAAIDAEAEKIVQRLDEEKAARADFSIGSGSGSGDDPEPEPEA